jgi:hypothetical protein
MDLPKISRPITVIELPSSGKKLKIQPYSAEDERNFLLAYEMGSKLDTLETTKTIMQKCILDKINIDDLPSIDFDYLFIKLLAKSGGDKHALNVVYNKCKHTESGICEKKLTLDLNQVIVDRNPDHNNKIKISDEYYVEMSLPTVSMITEDMINKLDNPDKSSEAYDAVLILIAKCIKCVYNETGDVYPMTGVDFSQIKSMVNDLERSRIDSIIEFFNTQPQLYYKCERKCIECQETFIIEFRGISDFL